MATPHSLCNNTASGVLEVVWDGDTATQCLDHALLRRRCRCAECKSGLTPATQGAHVRITAIRAIGSYAVQLVFNDGHERGIYPWAYLKSLTNDHPGAAPPAA